MRIDANKLADDVAAVVVAVDGHGVQLSNPAKRSLRHAAETLAWLSRQADWLAAAGPTPDTPAETEYREFVAMADVAMQNASNEDWAPWSRVVAGMEAQTYATLAQAAAVLMVPRPADPDVCSACGIEEVNIVNRHGRFCDQDCAHWAAGKGAGSLDTYEIRDAAGKFSATVYAGPLPQKPGESIEDYVDRLNESLEEAQLARIEAQNPGIDMDRVKDHRRRVRIGQAAHVGDESGGCMYHCEDTFR